MRKFCAFIVACVAVASATTVSLQAKTTASALGRYQGFIAVDAASGQVLLEEGADVANPPASMTKLMTFAVLSDKLASGALTLQTNVQVTAEDSSKGGTQVYLDPRENFPVEDLMYAMMIQSANDAANALARAAAGSAAAFVELMNAKARELGMNHTTFRTPHGLPPASRRVADGDISTPRDFALLCRYLVTHTDVLKYSSVQARDFGTSRKQGPIHMTNHNKLLGKVAGVDGLKTGYTASAGYCLSATAERNGRRVVAVIMGAFGPKGEIDKGRSRDLKAVEILERGFAALPAATGAVAAAVPVTKAVASTKTPVALPAPTEPIPSVKVEATPAEQSSTGAEPMFNFHVPSSEKK